MKNSLLLFAGKLKILLFVMLAAFVVSNNAKAEKLPLVPTVTYSTEVIPASTVLLMLQILDF